MKYIIIVDNDEKNCYLMKELLYTQHNKHPDYTIVSSFEFTSYDGSNIEKYLDEIMNIIHDCLKTEEDTLHFFIDLLLTKEEEQHAGNLSGVFQNGSYEKNQIASGIHFANCILQKLSEESINTDITFMSKWINLLTENPIRNFNGIKNNEIWTNIKLTSIINPFNDKHELVNLVLSVPSYGSRETVGVLFNVAFDEYE